MATTIHDVEKMKEIEKVFAERPSQLLQTIEKRKEAWRKTRDEVFPNAEEKFREIRKGMANGKFGAKSLRMITDDMAWLAAYYDFIVEAEGIAVARRKLNERFFDDNVFLLKAQGLVKTNNNNEARALATRMFPKFFVPMFKEICEAENTMSFLGIEPDSKQTPRSQSIQMIIEVYKKRHDALVRFGTVSGGGRVD